MRKNFSSGSPYEGKIGFSRAVRVSRFLAVSGTAAIGADGSVACPGDVYGQTIRCLEIIEAAVTDAGFSMQDVVRTRVMLIEIGSWEEAARAHGEIFGNVRPACTFVEVQELIEPEWLVEIEADCIADTAPQ
jgi:enamine deaminase RidA (YjgF/YER057c/UK114 family)